jgi:hypothetical protein
VVAVERGEHLVQRRALGRRVALLEHTAVPIEVYKYSVRSFLTVAIEFFLFMFDYLSYLNYLFKYVIL